MSDSPFIHLAVRSSYSLLESMITTKKLATWAGEQMMPAVAVTDRNNMFGALERSEALAGVGVQPIMACCFNVIEDAVRGYTSRISLYAQNEIGYARLMELSSFAYLESDDGVPRLKREHLFEATEGLIVLTGGAEGAIGQLCQKGKTEQAGEVLAELAAAYPGRCYLEITRHGSEAEALCEAGMISLAYAQDIPLVATHDARYMSPKDVEAHDAMMCISNGEYLGCLLYTSPSPRD